MSLKLFVFVLIAFKFAHKNTGLCSFTQPGLSELSFLPRSACFFWMLLACKAKAFGIYWKIKIGLNLFIFTCCSQDENTQESNSKLHKTFFFNLRKLLYLMKVCQLNFALEKTTKLRQSRPARNLKPFLLFMSLCFTHKSCISLI